MSPKHERTPNEEELQAERARRIEERAAERAARRAAERAAVEEEERAAAQAIESRGERPLSARERVALRAAKAREESPELANAAAYTSAPRETRRMPAMNRERFVDTTDLPTQAMPAVQPERQQTRRMPQQAPATVVTTAMPATPGGRGNGNDGGNGKGKGQGKKKSGGASKIIFRIALAVFAICVIVLAVFGVSYWMGQDKYNKIADTSGFTVSDNTTLPTLADVKIDWDALRAVNPETIAWVYVPGTVINYPVVQTSNNDKYIKTDFEGETNWVVSYGAIFLDSACEADMSCQNNYFYGHNMQNGAMFHELQNFDDDKTFNEHRTFYIFTPQGNYRLTSFALLHVPAYDELVQPNPGAGSAEFNYVQEQMNRSVVTPEGSLPDATLITKTMSLVTCDNLPSDGRYVLMGYVAESTVSGVAGLEDAATLDGTVARDAGTATVNPTDDVR